MSTHAQYHCTVNYINSRILFFSPTAIVHYLTSPKSGGFKLRAGSDQSDVQAFIQHLILIGLTGREQPKLMEEWKHLLPENENVLNLYEGLQVDLETIKDKVNELNDKVPISRPRKCESFNPEYLDCSVSK